MERAAVATESHADNEHPGLNKSHLHYHWQETVIRLAEATVWIIILTIIIVLRSFKSNIFQDESTLWLAGVVIAFALLYYSVIYRYFNDKQRYYIKDIADVIFIGILATLAKDYNIYFFTLYILPIAAAAFALNILNSLVIAVFASMFIAGNLILNTSFFAVIDPFYIGTFQISFLILVSFFARALAIQLRHEKSERTFFEEKLREVDKKLNDVEAIEEGFVSMTAHQLNSPLSIIRGYASLLYDGDAGKLNAKQKRYMKEIHDGSLRLGNIIADLLNITHLNTDVTLRYEPISLNRVISESVQTLQEKAISSSVALSMELTQKVNKIRGNKIQLEQVFSNLIDNAIKYSGTDNNAKEIIVRMQKVDPNDKDVIVTVEDNGVGIPEEEQSRIFQRFYRASNSFDLDTRGTGLGLYIAKRIIETHGGAISFTSIVGKGTIFKIRLPLVNTKQVKKGS